ncbi:MAG TPA: ABC transporter ATP-binding protein [Actinomycetota bacterium]
MAAALTVAGLTYAYPDGTRALDGVGFTVAPGERVAVIGPNGAGKTTLMLHLNGVLSATSGSVRVGDLVVGGTNEREVRRRVGLVFQDPDDQLFMPTVREDVAFGPANLGMDDVERRVHEALAAVEMQHVADRPPHHLSFGQRRRVAIATVLAMAPEILVLDEPTSNLDPASRRELGEILGRLPVTALVVTHDLPFALQQCPRALLLSAGRVIADAPTKQILADEPLLRAHRLELPYGFDAALLGT